MTQLNQWRSLAGLRGDPQVEEFVKGEFAPGADLPPDATTRREFMTLAGASLSLAGCRRPVEHIVPFVEAPEHTLPGVPKRYATTMPCGTSAYGLVVESHEGHPTKIEGNELHPATLGSSNARMQAATLELFDPDRSTHVLHKGERAAWADFVTAWKSLAAVHQQDGGAGLAVLAEPFAAPTLARLAAAFKQAFPKARWVTWEPTGEEHVHAGLERAAGRPLVRVHDLSAAKVVLALDSDFLLGDPEMVRHTRGLSQSRRVTSPDETPVRLYAVEGLHSVTGANADHRLRLQSRLVPAFVAALASELAHQGLALAAPAAEPPPGVTPAFVKALAADLLAHRGASLIIGGRRQPPALHAAVYALNAALGNAGRTVSYHEPVDTTLPSTAALGDLTRALGQGEVKTLVVLGANPAYAAPVDLGFAEAAKKAAEVVHVGLHVDETAALASWHVPAAHFLEAWGDARAAGGTPSVVQPLILPLYGGKSATEVLGLLATGEDKPGYDLVRATWQPVLGAAEFEKRWNRVLHDGLLADALLPALAPPPAAASLLEALSAEAARLGGASAALELVFEPCPRIHDGRYANLAWLQELPDAMTKAVWDNPLLLSPKTADALGLAKEEDTFAQRVRVEVSGRSLELPAIRVPGMADGTLVATLGYGRRAAGRVGNGVGIDTYALRGSEALDLALGATVKTLGAKVELSRTQEHGSMEGRAIVRSASVAEYRADPNFAHDAHAPELFSLWEEKKYTESPQWGMTIDLASCTGCNACAVACQSENNVPVVGKEQVRRGREMAWLRIDRYFEGEVETAGAVFQPVPCMQCENAPCEQVCPVAATVHDEQGLNAMVYNRCIGTRYCSNNCPYKVRRFNFFNYTKDTPESLKLAMNPDVTVRSRGVMEKCTYCVQRANRGRLDAKLGDRKLKDGDVKTACQQACPAQAIVFGDITDPDSQVSKLKRQPRNYSLLEELNTKPRTTYLARLRNPNPALEAHAPAGKDAHHG